MHFVKSHTGEHFTKALPVSLNLLAYIRLGDVLFYFFFFFFFFKPIANYIKGKSY